MKHNILKSLFISVILLAGTSNVWADGGIYLKPNSNWTQSNARFAAYFYNNNDNKWMSMSKSAKDGYYVCAIPDGYDKVIFCRMNGNTSENNWDNKWNQTGNLDVPTDEKIVCSINSGQWDCGTNVTWSGINWYISGDFNGWNTTANKMPCDISLTGGSHSLKIVSEYGDWFGNTGTMIRGNSSGWNMTYGENSNCTLTADLTGTYNFNCTGTRLTVTYPKECFVTGDFDDWKNTYSILNGSVAIQLTAGTHKFKIHRYDTDKADYWCSNEGTMTRGNCSEWTMYSSVDVDCQITADFEGEYIFTYDRSAGKLSVTYPEAYKITYGVGKKKGTNSVTTNPSITSGKLALASTSIIFSKGATIEGYVWKGWYSKEDGTGTEYTKNDTYTSKDRTGDVSVYACYDLQTYTITYNLNGGTNHANNPSNYTIESDITLQSATRAHYTFAGWYETEDFSGNIVTKIAKGTIGNKTLYAKWTPIEYNITYHLNGGTNHANNPDNYTVETPTITLQAPTKAGYTFDGWYSDAEFTGEKVTTIAKGTTGNLNLYAKWSETKYSVNINTNNRNWGITTPSGANWVGATPVNLIATHHTGYHFVNWTATGGASIADPNLATTTITATALGTVTAHFAESLYDITVLSSNDTYGKVTQSAPQAGVTTAITITAEPKEGYEFTGWSKTGDITIASINSATTTLTATSKGTVTANFAKKGSTPIYFKANHAWTAANAWFAVYYWNTNNEKGWSILNPICGSDYYKAEVPAGYTGFKFVRMRPSTASGYKSDNGGLNWTNPWNQSGDLVVPTDGKTMFDTKKVYLKPNDKWKTDNMRFAAYFYDDSKNEKWMSLELTSIDGVYTCDIPTEYEGEKDYKYVIFCRMDPSKSDNNWSNCKNKTVDLQLFDDSEGIKSFDKNCYTIWNDQWGKDPNNDNDSNPGATGYWSLINDEATYGVTLYSCSFGEYGFIYNNVEYTSPESGNITYQIPINATVKVFSRPYSKEYRGDVMLNQSGTKWEITPDNPLNITCNTILDDNYKTTGEHEVYLAVPNGESWANNTATLHYLYAFHDRTESGQGIPVQMTEVGHANVELNSKNVDHIYYRCVIPAEVNTIRFEKRSNAKTTVLSTIDLRYDIPLNSVNCYRLDSKGGTNNSYAGVWEHAPGFGSDFRLVHYRTAKDIYYSDIIRHGTISQTVSMHIYTKDANDNYPKLELQQRVNSEWETVSGQTKLVKDINKIMSNQQDQGCGVWNFTVTTDGGDNAKVNFDTPQRYTGNYYIRTNNAEGEWRNYTLSTNHMTFSSYAKNHSGYSHYYCRFIDLKDGSTVPGHNKNVKFTIACDYAANLSNEMIGDVHTTSGSDYTKGGDLPESANVRWTWNELDNTVSRAYILGSGEGVDHIVANNKKLNDQEDWIYEIDIDNVTQGQKLNIHADYPSKDIGTIKKTTQTFADNLEMIKTDPSNPNSYTVRVMYDFKINKTLIMLCPDQLNGANIGVDVFIDRPDQGEASQVKPGAIVTSSKPEGYTVYSTLTLTKEHLTSTTKTEWERLYYWISFPFDVRISEIFGFGEYGKHYIIQYYDGAARAKNGCWADSPTYWRQIKDTTYSPRTEELNNGNEDANGNPNNGILVANRGYVLALARNIANSNIFKHGNTYVRLYFPSREKIHSIDANMQDTTVYLRPHTCNITRDDRYIYDSNWHIIGVPSYANKEQILKEEDVLYFYTYNTADNTYNVTPAENASGNQTLTFKSMHAYMVQFAGNINWQSTWDLDAHSVVARRQSAEAQENYALRLELQRDGQYADQAFVQLKAEGATADFDMNQDLTKIINAGANIYTLAGEKRIQVAGNVLPIAKTTIPVGIQVAQAGTYTIALPDGTSGISASLVDNQTGTHTNLLLEDYTITLDAGSHENRFYIVLDPERTATAVENIGDAQGDKAQKFLIDGQLIIRTEQGVYDATGNNITNRQ